MPYKFTTILIIASVVSILTLFIQYELLYKVVGDRHSLLQMMKNAVAPDKYPFGTPSSNHWCQQNIPPFHIITGLMLIRKDSLTNADRESEPGLWLTNKQLRKIHKTVYHIDYYHKHAHKLVSRRIRKRNISDSLLNSIYSEYFSPLLISTPNLHIIPLANPSQAQECGLYLQYIVDYYDMLSDYSIFLHGDPQTHNPHLLQQLYWFFSRSKHELKNIDFLHLNCQEYVERYSTNAGTLLGLLGFDSQAFTNSGNLTENETASGLRYFASECCAQFIVSSKAIRNHSLDFWRLALKLTLDNRSFCIVWEYIWHAVFLNVQKLPKNLTLDHFYRQQNPSFSSKCLNGLRTDKV